MLFIAVYYNTLQYLIFHAAYLRYNYNGYFYEGVDEMLVVRALLTLFFNSSHIMDIVLVGLYMLGLFMMFQKSGVKGWHALIPGLREFDFARCAGCESDAPKYAISQVILAGLSVATLFYASSRPDKSAITSMDIALLSFATCLQLVNLVYGIRVRAGIVEVYGEKKRWLWLWIPPYLDCIPALIWGFNKKYQPGWKVDDIKAELAKLVHQGSATVMDEGLTVNLKDRTVVEAFQKKVLLRDIHMAIPQGHLVLLLGGSGAGKTTFVNAINGYEKANAEVMLNGHNIYTQYDQMIHEMGFVPQGDMMRGKNTVFNTLMDAAKLRLPIDVPDEDLRNRVNEVMDIFGLTPVQTNLVEKLSGGQRKRLSISMEMISNPQLFILDEPDSGLDGVMARALFEQLRKIADSGRIVIVITHTPDRVIDLFDDVIVLAKDSARTGRLAFYGSIADARRFFGREKMEDIVKAVNRKEEGGDGLADEFVMKYAKEVA